MDFDGECKFGVSEHMLVNGSFVVNMVRVIYNI